MKNFVILLTVGTAAYLLSTLLPVKIALNESLNGGTLKGVENCVTFSASELVSPETTQNACVAKFQKQLFDGDLVNGRAGPRFKDGKVFLGGNLQNDTTGHVTTWVRAYLGVYDEKGNKKEFSGETFIWIEPQSTTALNVELYGIERNELEDLEFCPRDEEESTHASCIYWGVSRVMGIEI